jgi:FkbM family methyltransferase
MYLANKLKISKNPAGEIILELDNKTFPFFCPEPLRGLMSQVLYGLDYPLPDLKNYQPEIIIDIGANVGATAVFFQSNFPAAEIFCYEPSAINYRYLSLNTRNFKNIRTFPYGLFNKSTEMVMYQGFHQSAENSVILSIETTKETEKIRLESFSQELSRQNIEKISILKLDTEGCEIPILEDLTGKLNIIDIMYIEYHSEKDRLKLDQMLSQEFILFFSAALRPHRGNLLYISKRLYSEYPYLEAYKLEFN